jgi:hypothetical protein
MTEPERLIGKHRASGLLIDSNLLLLLFVGRMNRSRIATFKRTDRYSPSDYDLLKKLVSMFRRTLTTPHILTEVSNLASLAEPQLGAIRRIMMNSVQLMHELHEQSRVVVRDQAYLRLGLTDAAISTVCGGVLVLTDDFPLYDLLRRKGIDAINFSHLRESYWQLTS